MPWGFIATSSSLHIGSHTQLILTMQGEGIGMNFDFTINNNILSKQLNILSSSSSGKILLKEPMFPFD